MGTDTRTERVCAVDCAHDPAVWTATGREVPVFFDHRGRRRHWVAGGGVTLVVIAVAWLAGLVGGALGFTGLPASTRSLPRAPQRVLSAVTAPHRPLAVARRDGQATLARGSGNRATL